jgi:hypothetical protein
VDLVLDAADYADRFAEVGLGMPWRMHKRLSTAERIQASVAE